MISLGKVGHNFNCVRKRCYLMGYPCVAIKRSVKCIRPPVGSTTRPAVSGSTFTANFAITHDAAFFSG
jgi:hypothetical protein